MTRPADRNINLDLARGIAALIVFLGHLYFGRLPQVTPPQYILDLISTGSMCVAFFFILSGYVLALGASKVSRPKWIAKRLIRLMPVYFICYFVPLIALIVTKSNYTPNSSGIAFGALAAQSFSTSHYLDMPNPPLWTLSIEVYLSFLFILIVKMKPIPLLLLVITFFGLYSNVETVHRIPFFFGVPLFILGILASKWTIALKNNLVRALGFLLIVTYVLFASYFVHGVRWINFSRIVFIVFLFIWLIQLKPIKRFRKFATFVGTRSYCIYAVHWPTMFFLDHLFLSFKDVPVLLQLASYVFLTLIVVETVYRVIEVRAISLSRLWSSNKHNLFKS